jgi:hypothetical protein
MRWSLPYYIPTKPHHIFSVFLVPSLSTFLFHLLLFLEVTMAGHVVVFMLLLLLPLLVFCNFGWEVAMCLWRPLHLHIPLPCLPLSQTQDYRLYGLCPPFSKTQDHRPSGPCLPLPSLTDSRRSWLRWMAARSLRLWAVAEDPIGRTMAAARANICFGWCGRMTMPLKA